MDPVVRFFARHPFVYAASVACAATFGAFALARAFREETAGQRARDLGLVAISAAEVGGMVVMGPKIRVEREFRAEAAA